MNLDNSVIDTMRVWRCKYCQSTNVQVAIYWGGSVEDVDQRSDKLEPDMCNADDPLVAEEFCNDCYSQEDGLLERVEVPYA